MTPRIFDGEGRVFARYNSGEERPFTRFRRGCRLTAAAVLSMTICICTSRLNTNGAQIGTVFIRASLRELNPLWQNFVFILTDHPRHGRHRLLSGHPLSHWQSGLCCGC